MKNIDLIIKARDFAIENHRRTGQLYDGLPYSIHLIGTVAFAHRFDYLLKCEDDVDDAICAAWIHDIIEDTGLTFNNVRKILGDRIAALATNLTTNIHGKTREERADDAYYARVKSDELSIFVKIADRLSNMYHSFNYGNKAMYERYKAELPHFKEHVYNGMYDEMWEMLENIESLPKYNTNYYDGIVKFDDETVSCINVPNPIPFEFYSEIYSKGIIRKKDLRKNTYYRGKSRNAKVALWNGFEFIHMRYKYGVYNVDSVNCLEDDNGCDLFIPVRIEEEPLETQRIKY